MQVLFFYFKSKEKQKESFYIKRMDFDLRHDSVSRLEWWLGSSIQKVENN